MKSLKTILVGSDVRLTGALFVMTIGLTLLVQFAYRFHPDRTMLGLVSFPELLMIPMFVPAFLHAYWNRGLIPCFCFGALAGILQNMYLYTHGVDPPYRSGPGSLTAVFTELQLLSVGVIIGAAAFVAGALAGWSLRTAHSFLVTSEQA